MKSFVDLFKKCGPGLLFAGAAIGVSHLVQSTRAGAGYGLGFVIPVLVVMILKLPSFAIGVLYSSQTGRSLLYGYKSQHRFFLLLFAALSLGSFFVVLAAVTMVTGGVFLAASGLNWPMFNTCLLILGGCLGILRFGGFALLDQLMKIVFLFMTLATLCATAIAASQITIKTSLFFPPGFWRYDTFVFTMALLGFMPAPVDIAVLNSYWTLEKKRIAAYSTADAWFDFKLGYGVTGLLSLCFMLLGAALFFGKSTPLSASPVAFSHQILDLYALQLGEWSRPLVGFCAFTVMFSTTLSIADGYPRVLVGVWTEWQEIDSQNIRASKLFYFIALILLCVGALMILWKFSTNLKQLVDFATTLTALISPVLAWQNHRVFFEDTSDSILQGRKLQTFKILSYCGIGLLAVLSVVYLSV